MDKYNLYDLSSQTSIKREKLDYKNRNLSISFYDLNKTVKIKVKL